MLDKWLWPCRLLVLLAIVWRSGSHMRWSNQQAHQAALPRFSSVPVISLIGGNMIIYWYVLVPGVGGRAEGIINPIVRFLPHRSPLPWVHDTLIIVQSQLRFSSRMPCAIFPWQKRPDTHGIERLEWFVGRRFAVLLNRLTLAVLKADFYGTCLCMQPERTLGASTIGNWSSHIGDTSFTHSRTDNLLSYL